MIELRVTCRELLGGLWLPWCVERDRPDRILRLDHESTRRSEARQLRIDSLGEPSCRAALANNGGVDSIDAITTLASAFRKLARLGSLRLAAALPLQPNEWPQVFPLPEGPMLHEACHRACALYESGIKEFEFVSLVHPIFDAWTIYEHAGLRT